MRKSAARLRVRVVQREVVDHDRYSEGNDEHAADDAHRAHHVAGVPGRDDVPVPDRRHRHDRPPDAERYVGKVGVVDEVNGAGEHEHPEHEEDNDEQELLRAHLDRVDEHLERSVVLHQLEYAQDTKGAQHHDALSTDSSSLWAFFLHIRFRIFTRSTNGLLQPLFISAMEP